VLVLLVWLPEKLLPLVVVDAVLDELVAEELVVVPVELELLVAELVTLPVVPVAAVVEAVDAPPVVVLAVVPPQAALARKRETPRVREILVIVSTFRGRFVRGSVRLPVGAERSNHFDRARWERATAPSAR
jgi:hypothetical protein